MEIALGASPTAIGVRLGRTRAQLRVAEPAPSHQSDMLSLAPSKKEGMFPEEPA
jgi:hypothetical protein